MMLSSAASGQMKLTSRPQAVAAPGLHNLHATQPSRLSKSESSIRSVVSQHSQAPFAGASLHVVKQRSQAHIACSHAAAASPEGGALGGSNLEKGLKLVALFTVWYGTNIFFNIYNKQLFAVFQYPLTTTLIQFMIGSILSVVFWTTGLVARPKIDAEFVKFFYPLALLNVLANVLTNVSLGKVAVSFTTTVKAAEPFFSVVFTYLFLGDWPPMQVLLTLIPIVGGVIIASVSEVSFTWLGFLSAMGSNILFQMRDVLSKKFMMNPKWKAMDSMSLFQTMSIMSFVTLLPIVLLVEGTPALPASLAAQGLSEATTQGIYRTLLLAGLCFHGYQQLSYLVLSHLHPVSHSVGNCLKRVAVIVASVMWFHNPITVQNAFGTTLAITGVFLYTQAKRIYDKK